MKQITVTVDSCLECPHYEPQSSEDCDIGECMELGETVAGYGIPDDCPYPDA